MGSKGFAMLPAALAVALVGVGVVGVATAQQMGVDVPILSSTADQPESGEDPKTGGSNNPVELRMVKWEEGFTVPLDVNAPVSAQLQGDIFVAKPDTDGDYGDYVDYNRTKATEGMTQGVDFFHQEGGSVSTLTFTPAEEISPGTYKAAIADNASSGSKEYHDLFTKIKVPSEVRFTNYDNSNAKTIIKSGEFDRRPNYDSDSYTLYKGSDTSNQVSFSDKDGAKDLATSAYGSSDDETFTIHRDVSYTHGVDYLEKVKVNTVNGTGSVNTEATCSVSTTTTNDQGETVEKTLFDEDLADSGSENDYDEVIKTVDGEKASDTNPSIVDDLEAECTVKFNGGAVTNGDLLFNATIEDVYGNRVGSNPFISLTS